MDEEEIEVGGIPQAEADPIASPTDAEDDGGVPTFSPAPDSIRDAFTKICEAYERQQTSLQRALEEAFQRGEASARISVRGSAYDVALRGDDRRQRGIGADAWRSRRVRRRLGSSSC